MLPGTVAKQREINERRVGASLAANEEDEQDHRQQCRAEEERRCGPPRIAFVQHHHDGRERGRNQERAVPVEPHVNRQVPGGRKHEPAHDGAGEPDGHVDEEHPAPIQHVEHQAPDCGACAEPHRLGRGLDAERAAPHLPAGRRHHDGDAVRGEERRADPLDDAECDEHRQVGGKAAQPRAQHEQEEAAGVKKLAPEDISKPPEDRQERRHGEQIRDRDPAYRAQLRVEFRFKVREEELRDAGIDLPHERADAHRAHHEPAVGRRPREHLRRRRFAAGAEGVAERGDRRRSVPGFGLGPWR